MEPPLKYGRVVKRDPSPASARSPARGDASQFGRVASKLTIDAEARALGILNKANQRAAELLANATAEAADVRLTVEAEARANRARRNRDSCGGARRARSEAGRPGPRSHG